MEAIHTCSKCGQKVPGTESVCPHCAAPLLSAGATARLGTRVGDYDIVSVIGEGATGAVYRGRHVIDGRKVAVKVLHDHCARRKELVTQLIGEAGAKGRIRHGHIMDVLDAGTTPDGTVFLATEYLEDESLQDRLRRVSRLPLFEAINILRQMARGLGVAHEAGMVHGALKPSNVFLCPRKGRRRIVRRSKATGMRLVVEPEESFDLVKLLDFGMARFLNFASAAETRTGDVAGTVQYMSPEQIEGRPADQRSDIYSLGAIFYEMITGTVPYGREWLADALKGHISDVMVAPSRRTPAAGINLRMDGLVLKCLKKNPLLRFASTADLCEVLDACVTDCAFLRDAHRLPGIVGSEIDLSEASPEARHDPARAAEKLKVAPPPEEPALVAEQPGAASVSEKPAPTEKPTQAEKPAPVVAKPVPAEKPTPVVAKPAPVVAKPAPAAAKPASAEKPAPTEKPAPAVAKPAPAEKPAPTADDPAAAMITPPPTIVAVAFDPAAAMETPPPEVPATPDDPAAAVTTPPPVLVAAKAPPEVSTRAADEPGQVRLERPEAFISNADERPERVHQERGVRPGKRTSAGLRQWPLIALVSVALLGAGLALYAARNGFAPNATWPVAVSHPAPAAVPAPSPAVAAPAPAPVAPAPAAPIPPAAAKPPSPPPAPEATEDVPAVRGPAALPEPAEPPRAAKTATREPGKRAAARSRPAPAKHARRAAALLAALPESGAADEPETTPAATPEPESEAASSAPSPAANEPESPSPSQAADEPALVPPPAAPEPPTVGDLVREAQQMWLRGHYGAAIGKAEAALDAEPKPAQAMQAYEIIATCSCALGRADAAREAMSHLNNTKREAVKAVCEKKGVTIE
jgi:serine/threonine protein kinase